MKVLVIGSGGREHALVWKIRQSPLVTEVFFTGENAGMEEIGKSARLNPMDFADVANFCYEQGIDLVVVGPEGPLAEGITDYLKDQGIRVFGPNKVAAELEANKGVAKMFMSRYNIPTAPYLILGDYDSALKHCLDERRPPFIIKANGLCAGKGVYPCFDKQSAVKALKEIMVDRKFGEAGSSVIVEDFLEGEEVSYICLTDGQTIMPMLSCQDHKRLLDNDQGPNTGGMGAYCPAPIMTSELKKKVRERILMPFIVGLNHDGIDYCGAIYFGLMIVNGEPYVLEFNVRFGDPETQPQLFAMESDLVPYLLACFEGTLVYKPPLKWKPGVAITVVLASAGYPEKPRVGKIICGLESLHGETVFAFHAGTRQQGGIVYSTGGRVLGITALGDDYLDARAKVYSAVDMVGFTDMQYRKDIGTSALRKNSKK